MGGGLAMRLACETPLIRAVVPFYGFPPEPIDIVQSLGGPAFIVFAENDDWIGQPARDKLQQALSEHNKQFEMKIYPGTHHGFFRDVENDQHDPAASKDSWDRMLKLFGDNL